MAPRRDPRVLDNAPVAVLLAILPANLAAQENMMAADYRHIGSLENRLGRHYSRFPPFSPTPALPGQSLALRKLCDAASNRRSQVKLLSRVAMAAVVVLALPAWAQGVTTQGQPTRENAPGTAGTSKPGVAGLPGSKSGPTVAPSGNTVPETNTRPSGDQSGVQGLPGNKSGPTQRPSTLGR
jgi:hypothetical protein